MIIYDNLFNRYLRSGNRCETNKCGVYNITRYSLLRLRYYLGSSTLI